MSNLSDNLVNQIYDDSIGDKYFRQSIFTDVLNDTTDFNDDDIVSDYFSNNHVGHEDLGIDITTCWYYLEDNNVKQFKINNTFHILKPNSHHFCNEIEYYLLGKFSQFSQNYTKKWLTIKQHSEFHVKHMQLSVNQVGRLNYSGGK